MSEIGGQKFGCLTSDISLPASSKLSHLKIIYKGIDSIFMHRCPFLFDLLHLRSNICYRTTSNKKFNNKWKLF